MHTQHFKPNEFNCKCCGRGNASAALLIVMEDLRRHFGVPFTPNSASRCKLHHAEIYHELSAKAGKTIKPPEHSDHLIENINGNEIECNGADIAIPGVSAADVYKYLDNCAYSDILALGRYRSFTHVGIRGYRARWKG